MKRPGLALAAALALGGCGGAGSSGTDENFFFEAGRNTAPAITPASGGSRVATSRSVLVSQWSWGNPVFEMFNTLRDYDDARDQGTIGIDNVYKTLFQAGQFYNEDRSRCSPVAAKAIASPFDFGNDVIYDCAMNDASSKHGHASREIGGVKSGLMTWQVDYSSNGVIERGAMQGHFADATGAVKIDEATYVDYLASDPTHGDHDFCVRFLIEGNASAHSFTLKLMKYNTNGYYWISLVGSGVSRGAGQYFLFKASDMTDGTWKYYCFPADVSETQMQSVAGSTTVDPHCLSHQAAVDALVPFTSTDVPTAASSFANSSIYLNY
jgi:hypothetical protein